MSTGHLLKLVHRPLPKGWPEATYLRLSTGHPARLVRSGHPPRFVCCRPPTKACPQATPQQLPKDYIPGIVHRSPSRARLPQATFPGLSTGHLPKVIHKLLSKAYSQATSPSLSTVVHRPPSKACPTGHLPKLVHRSPSQTCPQATFPGLSTGHLPKIVHRPLPNNCPLAAYQELFKGCPARLIRHKPPSEACLPQDTFQGLSATGHLPRFVNRPAPREMYKEQHGDYAN